MDQPSVPMRDPEDFALFATKPSNKVHLVMMESRPGILAFLAALEWTWYPPDSPRGRMLEVCTVSWQDILWLVASFPQGKFQDVKRLARKLALRVADGVPTMLEPPGPGQKGHPGFGGMVPKWFPGSVLPGGVNNMSMFNLENEEGSGKYMNHGKLAGEVRQCEMEIVDAFRNGARLTPEQIADYIYGTGPFPQDPGSRPIPMPDGRR